MAETQKTKVLRRLRQAGPRGVLTAEFLADVEIGSRFGARILELRKDGHSIETVTAKGGAKYVLRQWEYRVLQRTHAPGKEIYRTARAEELVIWASLYGVEDYLFERRDLIQGDFVPLPDPWLTKLRSSAMARRAERDARKAAERENATGAGEAA